MKKTLIMLTCILASLAVSWAFPREEKSKDPIPVPIFTKPKPGGDIPQSPSVSPLSVNYETETGLVTISTVAPMGIISVEFENLSTGTLITDSFDSTYPGVFFLPNESGTWEITLTLPSGAMFGGYFVI